MQNVWKYTLKCVISLSLTSKRFDFNFSFQTFEVISEAGKADEHKRNELLRLYIETREILNQLDDEFMNPLETSLGDIKTALEENIRSLAPRDQYVVLVAGRNLED